MLAFIRGALIALIMAITLVLTLWGTLAIWFQFPGPDFLRIATAAVFGLFGGVTVIAQFWQDRFRYLFAFLLAIIAVTLWWNTLSPPDDADWSPDVAHQVTGTLEGDTLTLSHVRNFSWRTPEEFEARWESRGYDVSTIASVDLFMSYWAGPQIAHMIVSFGFESGEYLAWSAEVRREEGSVYSPLADMFKSHSLVLIAADERDVVGTRTNARGEDVQLYRIATTPEAARALLVKYVETANGLADTPQWYNSLTANCTTVVIAMIRTLFEAVPLDWRIFVNGYLPEYAYDREVLDTRLSMAELRDRSHVTDAARKAGITEHFSEVIRANVPNPGMR